MTENSGYDRALSLILEHQRASASWLQRQMRIGYNEAARYIELAATEGFVGAPDHVGRREVLRPPSAALPGSSATVEQPAADSDVHPWERHAGKYDVPSSGIGPRSVHAARVAAGWEPPSEVATVAVATDPMPVPLTIGERPVEDIAADLVGLVGVDGARRIVRAAAEKRGELLPPDVRDPAVDWLTRIVERVEGLFAERTALAQEIRDAFSFAKEIGFHGAALRQVLKDRAADREKRFEFEANVTIYRHVLGVEDPDFSISLPAPAPPDPSKARKISAREKQLRDAVLLSAAANIEG